MRTGKLTVNSRLGARRIAHISWPRLRSSAAASNWATATANGLSTSGSLIATDYLLLRWPALAWMERHRSQPMEAAWSHTGTLQGHTSERAPGLDGALA